MKVKIKKLHTNAVIPKYAKPGDAGMDLTCVEVEKNEILNTVTYNTGIAVEIPPGYVGLIFPRSSVHKTGLTLCNSVGVIDSGYRGEIKLKFNVKRWISAYKKGDRIGQIVIIPYPNIDFVETDTLSDSERNSGGFGSTGV